MYNKEDFLEKCIQSIINLKMEKDEIEAIFIDDVSTDGSYNILQNYAEKYDFIRCIQMNENSGGPAEPRNLGIQKANGEFITILDADDWLESEGLPKLIYQMKRYESDIGFGQCYKHRNNEVIKVANFSSYKNDNGLVPYEIYKIFRAIGPWGKVFKKSTVTNNNIKFKNLKYAEDKLFYCELISKSESASMIKDPVYHVNRYSDNISLVKTTDVIDKSDYNLEVLKELIQMELPEYAKKQILCRIIEMDFISRFLMTKTFLKSHNKNLFYQRFDEVETIITNSGFVMEELIVNERYKSVYDAYHYNKEYFVKFIHYMTEQINSQKYIKDNIVYFKFPEEFNNLKEISSKCNGIFKGTQLIGNKFYDVINVLKYSDVIINSVKIVAINDERYSKNVNFEFKDDVIYIPTEQLDIKGIDFNILIIYNDFESTLVYSTSPKLNNNHNKLKKQNSKIEFVSSEKKESKSKLDKYLQNTPRFVVTIKETNLYNDVEFKDKIQPISKGQIIELLSNEKSSKGIPRLVTKNGLYLSANKDIVLPVNMDSLDNINN